jgi:hypothetical protein
MTTSRYRPVGWTTLGLAATLAACSDATAPTRFDALGGPLAALLNWIVDPLGAAVRVTSVRDRRAVALDHRDHTDDE